MLATIYHVILDLIDLSEHWETDPQSSQVLRFTTAQLSRILQDRKGWEKIRVKQTSDVADISVHMTGIVGHMLEIGRAINSYRKAIGRTAIDFVEEAINAEVRERKAKENQQ